MVITNPYEDLRPNQIDVYTYDTDYQIKVIEPEPEKEKPKKKKIVYCWLCDPPQYLEVTE